MCLSVLYHIVLRFDMIHDTRLGLVRKRDGVIGIYASHRTIEGRSMID